MSNLKKLTCLYPIDEAHLVEQLRYAEANWALEHERVRGVAEAFRKKHAWGAVLKNTISLIQQLAQVDDRTERSTLIARSVAVLTAA